VSRGNQKASNKQRQSCFEHERTWSSIENICNRTNSYVHFGKHDSWLSLRPRFPRQLAQRIKTLRINKVWTPEEFAERAAIQRSYLADLELGRGNPSVRTLVRVANAFGIAVPELFEGEEKKRPR
jgi:DNA-binding XRE family transcriptional regulator